jgi:spore germination cell wall hydrolase CwlJ-like protein
MPNSMTEILSFHQARLWPARLRPDHHWDAIGMAALALAGAGALAAATLPNTPAEALSSMVRLSIAPAAPFLPPPLLVRSLAPEDAIAINRATPLAGGENPAASPFKLRTKDVETQSRALECLTSAVYYEAGSQDGDGQRAVAQVVLNRVRHPAFPASVCGVVYQGSTRGTGCQFTFTCDGSLNRVPSAEAWDRARKIAWAALNGAVYAPVGYATHYHADYVVPYWASSLAKNAVVGAHIFYRWSGGWGTPQAFTKRYAALEPDSLALREAALAAEARQPGLDGGDIDVIANIPGAQLQGAPDGRVGVRFNLEARAAVEKAVQKAQNHDYVEKFDASENLRWGLNDDEQPPAEQPLGKAAAAVPVATAAAAATGGAAALAATQK